MCRRLLDAVGVSLVISSILELKQQRLRLLNTSRLPTAIPRPAASMGLTS
jgi:hypothetical protein